MLVSVALEGDRDYEELKKMAVVADRSGLYSVQFYEHLPMRPAWPACSIAGCVTTKVKVGPVTVPSFAYDVLSLARLIAAHREFLGERAIVGISRGAYEGLIGRQKQSLAEFVGFLNDLYLMLSRPPRGMNWIKDMLPEIYVGGSGLKLIASIAKLPFVSGIVVDCLWNEDYARIIRSIVDGALSKTGRKAEAFQIIARPPCYLSSDRRQALRKIAPIVGKFLMELVGPSPMLSNVGIDYEELKGIDFTSPTEELAEIISKFAFFGGIDDLVEKCHSILKTGVTHICLGYPLGDNAAEVIRQIGKHLNADQDRSVRS